MAVSRYMCLRTPKRVKVKCKRHLSIAALTATFFPWPQAQVDRKHGWWYLKDGQWLLRVPIFPFLNPAQTEAYPA
jgi:hypothetical protein